MTTFFFNPASTVVSPQTIRKELNKFANQAIRECSPAISQMTHQMATPMTNIIKHESKFEIQLNVAGYAKNEIKIDLDQEKLTVHAQLEDTQTTVENKWLHKEYSKKAFSRSFLLPENIDANSVIAKQVDGILTITLNIKPETQPEPSKTIAIQ